MAYKQPSSGPFKMMGSSPAKQKDPFEKLYKKVNPNDPKAIKGKHYPSKETVKKLKKGPYTKGGQNAGNFNIKGGKTTTPGHSTTKIAKTQNFRDAANKIKTVSSKTNFKKKLLKGAGKVVGKAGKFIGGKSLGVAGMLMATSSKADQPTKGKGKKEYEGGKIDFTKER